MKLDWCSLNVEHNCLLGTGMGHGWTRAFQEEYGGALLSQCSRSRLRLWCHQNGLLPESEVMDPGMQWPPRLTESSPGFGGQQVWFGEPDSGAFQHSSQVCRRSQHAAVWNLGQRPHREPECGLYIYVLGSSAQSSEVPELQGCGEGRWQSEAVTGNWNKKQLLMLMLMFDQYQKIKNTI